jgi:formylmethanofuran dehydrogenase subunit B
VLQFRVWRSRTATAAAAATGADFTMAHRLHDRTAMTESAATANTADFGTTPWTCPFCPLLCDSFSVQVDASKRELTLAGSDCVRARLALAKFHPGPSTARPRVDGRECDLATAVNAAAALLNASRQPLFAGLGTDVAGARALYCLASDTGAISDAANGTTLMHGLRALQDRGAYTTTLAEVRTRADVIVCVGGSPLARQPEFFRRCGVGESTVAQRHLVFLGSEIGDATALAALPGITVESLPLQGDLFDTVALLAACVAGAAAPPRLAALAERLRSAHYAVLVWEAASLPAQGALIVEGLNRIVGTLNHSTRAATLPLGGGDGAGTANQVFAWLSGLPLRSRGGPTGLEHEPLRFDTARLLADGAVDALLWVSSFGATALPPSLRLPHIVLGHPALAAPLAAAAAAAATGPSVIIPVAAPGIGSAGHLFRTDGVVLMPLSAVLDDGLPTVAEVVLQLRRALLALRQKAAA